MNHKHRVFPRKYSSCLQFAGPAWQKGFSFLILICISDQAADVESPNVDEFLVHLSGNVSPLDDAHCTICCNPIEAFEQYSLPGIGSQKEQGQTRVCEACWLLEPARQGNISSSLVLRWLHLPVSFIFFHMSSLFYKWVRNLHIV
jgi:hypothetical protein